MKTNRKCHSKRNLSIFDCVRSNLLWHKKSDVRSFSYTFSRKGDPLGFMAVAYNVAYTPNLINNPLGGAFILLMGMSAILFFLVTGLPGVLMEDHSLAFIIQQLDSILLLCERLVLEEQRAVDLLLANLNNYAPGSELLYRICFLFQEHALARESLFSRFSILVDLPIIQFLPGPLIDRIHGNFKRGF